jgi:hypothetical protein
MVQGNLPLAVESSGTWIPPHAKSIISYCRVGTAHGIGTAAGFEGQEE